jgi:hypothetical protein
LFDLKEKFWRKKIMKINGWKISLSLSIDFRNFIFFRFLSTKSSTPKTQTSLINNSTLLHLSSIKDKSLFGKTKKLSYTSLKAKNFDWYQVFQYEFIAYYFTDVILSSLWVYSLLFFLLISPLLFYLNSTFTLYYLLYNLK